jgi:hypothetical protein
VIALPAEAQGALAVGWATVELERSARELSHLLDPGASFEAAPASAILGARAVVGPAADVPGLRIVLLEPETEGRLAAALARTGEGWVATWDLDPGADLRRRQSSIPRPGPLGDERLLLGEAVTGPYRLLVKLVPSPP